MYAKRRKFKYALQYSALRAYEGQEIFVFSDELKIPRSSTLPNGRTRAEVPTFSLAGIGCVRTASSESRYREAAAELRAAIAHGKVRMVPLSF